MQIQMVGKYKKETKSTKAKTIASYTTQSHLWIIFVHQMNLVGVITISSFIVYCSDNHLEKSSDHFVLFHYSNKSWSLDLESAGLEDSKTTLHLLIAKTWSIVTSIWNKSNIPNFFPLLWNYFSTLINIWSLSKSVSKPNSPS